MDFDVASRWLSDPSLNRWLSAEWRGRTVTASVLAMVLRNRRNRMMMVEHDGQPVGLVGFADVDDADGTAMIWYIKGVRTGARGGEISIGVGLAVQWAFDHLGLHSVYAWIMADNAPSRKVLELAHGRDRPDESG